MRKILLISALLTTTIILPNYSYAQESGSFNKNNVVFLKTSSSMDFSSALVYNSKPQKTNEEIKYIQELTAIVKENNNVFMEKNKDLIHKDKDLNLKTKTVSQEDEELLNIQ